MIFINLL